MRPVPPHAAQPTATPEPLYKPLLLPRCPLGECPGSIHFSTQMLPLTRPPVLQHSLAGHLPSLRIYPMRHVTHTSAWCSSPTPLLSLSSTVVKSPMGLLVLEGHEPPLSKSTALSRVCRSRTLVTLEGRAQHSCGLSILQWQGLVFDQHLSLELCWAHWRDFWIGLNMSL
jgi:hypothetical protein